MDFKLGDDVFVGPKNLPAKVRYIGKTTFAKGTWIGVELSGREDQGKNSGSVNGERYFSCRHDKGLFLRPASVTTSASATGDQESTNAAAAAAATSKKESHPTKTKRNKAVQEE